jgi:isopentenyl phosphate kinase
MSELILLKLGGSLITDKTHPYTPRLDILSDLARQILAAKQSRPELALVLGHGSGSFGHVAAKEYKTREGIPLRLPPFSTKIGAEKEGSYWFGFSEVWFQASALNRFVMEALRWAGVPALALAPVSAVTARDGKVSRWDLTPLKSALSAGLVPVVYGDVVFDQARGGTILSTEDLFEHLARELRPGRILLAGLEGAVWADFPERRNRVEKITPASFNEVRAGVGQSHGADVTGGMESKVRQMLDLVTHIPGLTAQIFSGEEPGNIQKALAGENLGTLVCER